MRGKLLAILCLLACNAAFAQTAAPQNTAEQTWQKLHFLLGMWDAKTAPDGKSPAITGTYTFREDLNGNAIVRNSSFDNCPNGAALNCQHHDLLTIYRDGGAVAALYVDSEGHVIHYTATVPEAGTAILQSAGNGPQYRLVYQLYQGTGAPQMHGRFQVMAPGAAQFRTYAEWSGAKK